MPEDSFEQNISGVAALIADDTNKVGAGADVEEGIDGDYEDVLELPMADTDLLELRTEWENKSNTYQPKIKARQKANKAYVRGVQRSTGQGEGVVPSNILFEATATFVPQALAKNPEPVVFSDNTDDGKSASGEIKTMLQYHADVLCLRKKLGVMVWHWSIYFIGVVKHGWDAKSSDIKSEIRRPENFILDPDGYIDEFGDFRGEFLGERIQTTAKKLIDLFPAHETYITIKANAKLGTKLTYTQWWTDEYSFSTFEEKVLEKHKNEFFNYGVEAKTNGEGVETQGAIPAINHFAAPKMPYTFLSVFSLQDEPYDFTNLIEQNIPNQNRINDRDEQIDKNLASANNSVVLSGLSFTAETAQQATQSFYEEGFILVPDGNVENGVKRIPANEVPQSVFTAQEAAETKLRSIYGTLGSTPSTEPDQRVRNNILNEQHDATRTSGGVGDALEQVADNIFNWWVQLYAVFYDETHYGAIMGSGRAVEYVQLINAALNRKFVISVAPDSMKPKDEISEQNIAMERWNNHAIDPIGLMKAINDPDPLESAKMLVMWTTNPAQYAMTFFPEVQPQQPAAPGAGVPPEGPAPNPSLAAPAASNALSQVPINNIAVPT